MSQRDSLRQSLHRSVLFKDIGSEEVDRIIAAAHWRTVEKGQYVYRQGENDGHFYIVAQGEAELTMNVAGANGSWSVTSVLEVTSVKPPC